MLTGVCVCVLYFKVLFSFKLLNFTFLWYFFFSCSQVFLLSLALFSFPYFLMFLNFGCMSLCHATFCFCCTVVLSFQIGSFWVNQADIKVLLPQPPEHLGLQEWTFTPFYFLFQREKLFIFILHSAFLLFEYSNFCSGSVFPFFLLKCFLIPLKHFTLEM